jgi:GTPase SAR1 family protein
MAVRAASRAASRADELLEQDGIVWTQSSKPPQRLQIAILGAAGSGKTAMVQYVFRPEIPAVAAC